MGRTSVSVSVISRPTCFRMGHFDAVIGVRGALVPNLASVVPTVKVLLRN
jgi:hypothetical protein